MILKIFTIVFCGWNVINSILIAKLYLKYKKDRNGQDNLLTEDDAKLFI